jgi:exopolyphosphatase/guanosine-5'-triphosphate,3'-diphosphate pyrophosphatase
MSSRVLPPPPIRVVDRYADSPNAHRIAALDLGSNSFHLVLAWVEQGVPHVYDRRREQVSLGRGLRDGEPLDRGAKARALACLRRFGALLEPLPASDVRIVGTDALRRASDGLALVAQAEELLGHPVDIVPGYEEARLIWRGVTAMRPPNERERRLVIDIGGGSTEVMTGSGFTLEEAHSTPMGCIRFSERFFGGGRTSGERYAKARDAALLELRPFAARMAAREITLAMGSSGTMRSIGEILALHGWSSSPAEITRDGVARLAKRLVEAERVDDLVLAGLSVDRRPVLPGGLAIVDAVMRTFDLSTLAVAEGALREGLLMEIVGRLSDEDVRDDTVASMAERHSVDRSHARRVRFAAERLFDEVADAWKIGSSENRRALGWAAELHEIGLSVAHTGVARHGAYLVEHADAPGFSHAALTSLALVVRGHRGRIDPTRFRALPRTNRRTTTRLTALLRIAVALHADRRDEAVPVTATAHRKRLTLRLPKDWTALRSTMIAELAAHRRELRTLGVKLSLASED